MFNNEIVKLVQSQMFDVSCSSRSVDLYDLWVMSNTVFEEFRFFDSNGLSDDELEKLVSLLSIPTNTELCEEVYEIIVLIMEFCNVEYDNSDLCHTHLFMEDCVSNVRKFDLSDDVFDLRHEKYVWKEVHGWNYFTQVLPYHLKCLRKTMLVCDSRKTSFTNVE